MIDQSLPKTADDALKKIARLVSVRDRSVSEMRKRLIELEFEEQQVEEALHRALECGLLDDERFAQSYITRKLASGWGRDRIKKSLKEFEVDFNDLKDCPEVFLDEDVEIERAIRELARFRTNARNVREARYRRLAAKGYSYDVISAALIRIEANRSD